jgi:hypothetical protein
MIQWIAQSARYRPLRLIVAATLLLFTAELLLYGNLFFVIEQPLRAVFIVVRAILLNYFLFWAGSKFISASLEAVNLIKLALILLFYSILLTISRLDIYYYDYGFGAEFDFDSYFFNVQSIFSVDLFSNFLNGFLSLTGLIYVAQNLFFVAVGVYGKSSGTGNYLSPGYTNALGRGYGGRNMVNENGEATRLVLASLVLQGSLFRRKIIEKLQLRARAFAPEGDLDIARVKTVSQQLERRELFYEWLFLAGFLVFLIGMVMESEPILWLSAIGIILINVSKSAEERFHTKTLLESIEKEEAATSEDTRNDSNVIVYKGFLPFEAFGYATDRIAFSADLSKRKDQSDTAVDVDLRELYEAVGASLEREWGDKIRASDFVFVHGEDIAGLTEVLPDKFGRPVQQQSDQWIASFLDKADTNARFYRRFENLSWGGELGISYFVRIAKHQKALHVEITRCLTTPIADEYRKIDTLRRPQFLTGLSWAIGTGAIALLKAPFATLSLIGRAMVGMSSLVFGDPVDRMLKQEIATNPKHNYGAEVPIRQELSSPGYNHYFQLMDKDFLEKSIFENIYTTLIDSLDAQGVDVSLLKDGGQVIINSGLLVQGGDVTATNLAVGDNAKASSKKKVNPVSGIGARMRKAGSAQ